MNTRQILNVLDSQLPCTKARYWNCVPADGLKPELFAKEKLPSCIIFNTQDSSLPGRHWLALIGSKRGLIYFDSYGKRLESYGFHGIKAHSRYKDIQGNSNLCGVYAFLFLLYTIRNGSPASFYKLFNNDKKKNDEKAARLFNSLQPCSQSRRRCVHQTCRKRT